MNNVFSIPYQQHTLEAGFSRHSSEIFRGCVIYLHGGGLVFGTRKDLPGQYQELFLAAGYDLIALDYPLAPESDLAEIQDAVHTAVLFLLSHPQLCGYEDFPPFFLFGRSAGAYLALCEAKRLGRNGISDTAKLPKLMGILSFYGYHRLSLPEFTKPIPYYRQFLEVTRENILPLIGDRFLTDGPVTERYSIYIYARQSGSWLSFLCKGTDPADYELSDEDLALLPPCFFTASTGDQDVPFRESKSMAALVPESAFYPVYFLPHDFDRDISCEESRLVYQAALEWMQNLTD